MGTDKLEKVLEKLAVTDKSTLVISKEIDGKMRVTSGCWEGEKVFLPDQVLEVRNVEGRLPGRERTVSFSADRAATTAVGGSMGRPFCGGVIDYSFSKRLGVL